MLDSFLIDSYELVDTHYRLTVNQVSIKCQLSIDWDIDQISIIEGIDREY